MPLFQTPLQRHFKVSTNIPERFVADDERERMKLALLRVREALHAKGIPFFLTFGTCLGAVRENRIIPYDMDIDLAFYKEDSVRLRDALVELEEHRLFIESVHPFNLAVYIEGSQCHLDLYVITKPSWFYRLQGHRWFCDHCYYRADYFDPKRLSEATCYDELFRVPSPPEDYLEELYGADWRTPIPERNARYRAFISRILNFFFVDSVMPSKFSGNKLTCTFKPWVNWFMVRFFPNLRITRKLRIPDS